MSERIVVRMYASPVRWGNFLKVAQINYRSLRTERGRISALVEALRMARRGELSIVKRGAWLMRLDNLGFNLGDLNDHDGA